MLEHRGDTDGSSASPERDLLLGAQFPRRLRAALRASVLGSLGLHGEQSSGSGFLQTSPGHRGAQREMPRRVHTQLSEHPKPKATQGWRSPRKGSTTQGKIRTDASFSCWAA